MPAALHPYLNFPGTSREAFEFYGQALGATPQFLTFGEAGAVPVDDLGADKIMHANLEVTDLIRLEAPPYFLTFGEAGAAPGYDPRADKIMHGSLEVTDLIRLYVSAVIEGMSAEGFVQGTTVTLSLMGDGEAVLRSAYEKVS